MTDDVRKTHVPPATVTGSVEARWRRGYCRFAFSLRALGSRHILALALLLWTMVIPQQTAVDADALLARAAEGERQSAAGTVARHVRSQVTPASTSPDRVADALAAHQFNSQNPLSATAFQAWRARLLAKHDVITRSSESLVIIHTIAAEGSLHEAEIALNPATNTATALKLTFDDFAVDIREMAGWHPSTPSTIPTASTTPGVPVPPAPDLALDRDIKRARAGLSSAPRLLLVPSWNIRTRPSYLWDSDIRERERYAVEMLPVFAAIEQRLAVLDDLAKTYPAREVDDWSPARRVKLRTLVTTHYGAVSAALDDLHNRWHSILGPQDRATPRDPFTPDWQQNVVPQRRQARDLSRLANQVLMNLPRAANESKQAELEGVECAFDALWNVIYHATTKISPRCDVPPR